MRNLNSLPHSLLVLCWAAVVRSDNVVFRQISNGTTDSSDTTTSSQTSLDTAAISTTGSATSSTVSSAPTLPVSGLSQAVTYTGETTDYSGLNLYCTAHWQAYLSNNGGGTETTSIKTTTVTWLINESSTGSIWTSTSTTSFTTIGSQYPAYTPLAECVQCTIFPQSVRLNYWPTPVVNGTTVTPTITAQSAIVDSATFYSPSNYLVFTGVQATVCDLGYGGPCSTKTYTDKTLSFNDLSTINCFGATKAINYADFNTPIPYSIYVPALWKCEVPAQFISTYYGTSLDYTDTLNPNIAFPSGFQTSIDPALASCFVHTDFGIMDPPTALSSVKQLTPSASPGPSVTTPNATPTPTVPPVESETVTTSSASPAGPTPVKPTAVQTPPVETIPAQSSSVVTPDTPAQTPDPPVQTTTPPASPPAIPADPGTSVAAGPSPDDPGTSVAADPSPNDSGNTASASPADPNLQVTQPVVTPAQSPAGDATSIGVIIASVGGISSVPSDQDSTIIIPGANTGTAAAPAPLVTTVGGQAISVAPGSVTTILGSVLNVGGVKTTLPNVIITGPTAAPTSSIIATIASNTITIAPNGGSAVVGGQTVTAGASPITVSSVIVSLGPSGLVVGSTTVALAPSSSSSGTSYVGLNGSTTSPGGPLQASSASTFSSSKVSACSLAFTALFAWIAV